jgi:hypothetical protein
MKLKKIFYYNIILIVAIVLFAGCANQPTHKIKIQTIEPPKAITQQVVIKSKQIKKQQPKQQIKKQDNIIALLFPSSNIGKYAQDAIDVVNTYLLTYHIEATMQIFDTYTFNKTNIINQIKKIRDQNITKVIAMLTSSEVKLLEQIDGIDDIVFYFPLVNKNDIKDVKLLENKNIIYGAINYKSQFDALISFVRTKRLVDFYDNSPIGAVLHNYLKDTKLIYTKKINNNNGSYKRFLKHNRYLTNSTIILNTPIVKSSILLSTLTANEVKYANILSTQINYTSLIFSLTQISDRRNLIVASSTTQYPYNLEEYIQLVHSNLKYNWVNYSIAVGTEYLMNSKLVRFKEVKLHNNQITYPIYLYKVGRSSFKLLKTITPK